MSSIHKVPNRVTIDLEAIRHNYRQLKKAVGGKTGVTAVIKSDAYGHGMVPVAKALEKESPPCFAVFELEEALTLRENGCVSDILILLGISPEEAPAAVAGDFTVSIFSQEVAQALSHACRKEEKTVAVHIKADTGMTRLGVPWSSVSGFVSTIKPLKGLRLEGIFSHLAVADEAGHPFTETQVQRFYRAVEEAKSLGVSFRAVHLANSGAVLQNIGTDLDMVRPGIALYGSPPSKGLDRNLSLQPAMSFSSRIVRVETVPPKTPVSYGCTYATTKKQTIATIPVGYDDGFNRRLSNCGEVLVRGKRAPVVGRVCMNLTMIDVSAISGVAVGDDVVLLGKQGKETITAEEIAEKTGTISYEIYCSLGKSNTRIYKNA